MLRCSRSPDPAIRSEDKRRVNGGATRVEPVVNMSHDKRTMLFRLIYRGKYVVVCSRCVRLLRYDFELLVEVEVDGKMKMRWLAARVTMVRHHFRIRRWFQDKLFKSHRQIFRPPSSSQDEGGLAIYARTPAYRSMRRVAGHTPLLQILTDEQDVRIDR